MRSFLLRGSLVAALIGAAFGPARAQTPDSLRRPDRIEARTQRTGTTVTLRWAPTSPRAWALGNDVGYVVERMILPDSTQPRDRRAAGTFERLNAAPLRPWPIETWRQRATPDDRYAAIAAQMLYGPSATPTGRLAPGQQLRNQAAELTNRHSFSVFAADLSAVAADGLALRWADTAPAGQAVLYRIFLSTNPQDLPVDTAFVVADGGDTPRYGPPPGVRAEAQDGAVRLTWPLSTLGFSYSAYWLERADGAGAFRRLNVDPFVPVINTQQREAIFTDSTVVNYRRYRYRIIGLTPFAGTSEPAEVEAMPRDLTPPPAPRITRTTHLRESTVQIEWTDDGPPAPDLRGYKVGISSSPDGPFGYSNDVLPRTARSATDSRARSGERTYYAVAAVDTSGNAGESLPMFVQVVDTVGPSRPVGLAADVSVLEGSQGLVRLRWRLPPEPDLMAFRVYRANERGHLFTLDHPYPVLDSTYADTLDVRTLTRAIYYRIVALDRNYNPSDSSDILRVVLPDIVPPAQPVFSAVTPTDSTVYLAWHPSPSEDLARVHVLRRAPGETAYQPLTTVAADVLAFVDRRVVQGQTYVYTLVAEDSTGLRSPEAVPVQGRPYDTGVRPGVVGLRATATPEAVNVAWQYPVNGDYWFVLYRDDGDGELRRLRSTGREMQAAERVPAGTYRYAVQVFYRDGGMSPISPAVSVTKAP